MEVTSTWHFRPIMNLAIFNLITFSFHLQIEIFQKQICSPWNDIPKSVISFQLKLICFLKTSIKWLRIFLEIWFPTLPFDRILILGMQPHFIVIFFKNFSAISRRFYLGKVWSPKPWSKSLGHFKISHSQSQSSNWESWECLHLKLPHIFSSCASVFSLFLC
jgi:hypothetical protein